MRGLPGSACPVLGCPRYTLLLPKCEGCTYQSGAPCTTGVHGFARVQMSRPGVADVMPLCLQHLLLQKSGPSCGAAVLCRILLLVVLGGSGCQCRREGTYFVRGCRAGSRMPPVWSHLSCRLHQKRALQVQTGNRTTQSCHAATCACLLQFGQYLVTFVLVRLTALSHTPVTPACVAPVAWVVSAVRMTTAQRCVRCGVHV